MATLQYSKISTSDSLSKFDPPENQRHTQNTNFCFRYVVGWSLLNSCDWYLTSNLEVHVYKFRDWWIFAYFIFWHGESSPNNIWSMVNLQRTCVLLFYYFLCLEVNLDLEKTNQLGESSPNFIFVVVNLDPMILEKRWIDGESWPNDFVEKVNRGEDWRWVGSRCPLTRA